MQSQRQPSPGQVIDGRYRVEHFVARGGMATVYRAHDLRLERPVALKIMHPALAEDPEFVRRFVREARSAAQLTHPAIVAVYDQGESDDLVYLAMEFVPGRNLRDLIAADGRLPQTAALGVLEQVLEALSSAHTAGIVHRDIKPENILLTPNGHVKVADFGLARAIESTTHSAATAGLLIGTVAYLAPEQVERGAADTRADVYAAGIVLYECLTGTTPYSGDTPLSVAYQHVHGNVPAPSRAVPGISPAVDELVLVATQRDPAARYSDADDFAQHLRTLRPLLPEASSETVILVRGAEGAGHSSRFISLEHDRVGVGAQAGTGLLTTAVGLQRLQLSEGPPGLPPDDLAAGPTPPIPPGPTSNGDHRAIKPPRRHRVLLATLSLITLALVAGGTAWYVGVSQYQTVPTLIGLSPAAATDKLRALELAFTVDGQDFSEDIPKGMITATDPEPGGRARDNSTVHAHTSKGPERHQVPALRGLTIAEAESALAAATLKVGSTTQQYDDKIKSDRIISTTPESATAVKRDSAVDIVVSKGPAPVDVPNTVGMKDAKANKSLAAAGLVASAGKQIYSDTVPTGVVISSTPKPGTGVHRGDVVTLTVSKGPPPVPVPRVVGMSTDDARASLQAAGFRVSVVKRLPVVMIGRVYSQSPGGGDSAPRGSTVEITIV